MKTKNIIIYTKDGAQHPLTLSQSAYATLRRQIGTAMNHPAARMVIHNEAGGVLFDQPMGNIRPMLREV